MNKGRILGITGAFLMLLAVVITVYTLFDGMGNDSTLEMSGYLMFLIGLGLSAISAKMKKRKETDVNAL